LLEPDAPVAPLYEVLFQCAESFKKYCVLVSAMEIGLFERLRTPRTLDNLCHVLALSGKLIRMVNLSLSDR